MISKLFVIFKIAKTTNIIIQSSFIKVYINQILSFSDINFSNI